MLSFELRKQSRLAFPRAGRTLADMGEWLRLALDRRVARRALAYAVVVGAVLIAINHGDALAAGDVDGARAFRMGLTVLVPYTVSTLSSVGAIRAAGKRDGPASPAGDVDISR